jgi:molybdate transport system substrate-binding protein
VPDFRSIVVALALAALASAAVRADDPPAIAAASDLQFALTDVAEAFRAADGREVRLTFGSSGNFFRQIQESAPFELYMSADEQFVFDWPPPG